MEIPFGPIGLPVHDLPDLLYVGVIWGMRAPSWIRRIGGPS